MRAAVRTHMSSLCRLAADGRVLVSGSTSAHDAEVRRAYGPRPWREFDECVEALDRALLNMSARVDDVLVLGRRINDEEGCAPEVARRLRALQDVFSAATDAFLDHVVFLAVAAHQTAFAWAAPLVAAYEDRLHLAAQLTEDFERGVRYVLPRLAAVGCAPSAACHGDQSDLHHVLVQTGRHSPRIVAEQSVH